MIRALLITVGILALLDYAHAGASKEAKHQEAMQLQDACYATAAGLYDDGISSVEIVARVVRRSCDKVEILVYRTRDKKLDGLYRSYDALVADREKRFDDYAFAAILKVRATRRQQ